MSASFGSQPNFIQTGYSAAGYAASADCAASAGCAACCCHRDESCDGDDESDDGSTLLLCDDGYDDGPFYTSMSDFILRKMEGDHRMIPMRLKRWNTSYP